jgi:hypothetical protein
MFLPLLRFRIPQDFLADGEVLALLTGRSRAQLAALLALPKWLTSSATSWPM